MTFSHPGSGCHILVEKRRTKSIKMKHQKRQRNKKLKARIRRLKLEMKEISADQKSIREGQTQVREKFKEIESECAQLRKESNLISQQSQDTQLRLDLMFKILKARQAKEFDKANSLTQSLRELIATQNAKKQSNDKDGLCLITPLFVLNKGFNAPSNKKIEEKWVREKD